MSGLTVALFVAYVLATTAMVAVLAMPWPRDAPGFRRHAKAFTASQVVFAATGIATLAAAALEWQP